MGGKRGQEDPLVNVFWYHLAHRNLTLDGRLQTQVRSEMLAPHMHFRIHALVPRGRGGEGDRGRGREREGERERGKEGEKEDMNEYEYVCTIHLWGEGRREGGKAEP